MKNRYGVEYTFRQVSPVAYKFEMEHLGNVRVAGKGDKLTMFDPVGGPYIAIGTELSWREIKGREYTQGNLRVVGIRQDATGIYVTTEKV